MISYCNIRCTLTILYLSGIYAYTGDPQACRDDRNGKTPGYVTYNDKKMVIKELANRTYHDVSFLQCETNCVMDHYCQMADYDKTSNSCALYHSLIDMVFHDDHIVFKWKFCDLSKTTRFKQGAPGIWFYTVRFIRNTKLLDTLGTLTCGRETCKKRCFLEELCGGFNFIDEKKWCQLLMIWDNKPPDFTINVTSVTYYWMLQHPISYSIDEHNCRKLESKPCLGVWKSSTYISRDKANIIGIFQTRNFTQCYKACEYYKHCTEVIYYYYHSLCYLKSSTMAPCIVKKWLPHDKGVSVKWTCCNKYAKSRRLDKMGSCHKIAEPNYVVLTKFRCSFPPINILENCTTTNKQLSLSCYVDQAFLSLDLHWKDYLKIYNGWEAFWIKNATNQTFPVANDWACKMYDATIPKHQPIRMTNISQWYPIQNNETYKKFSRHIDTVIVGVLPDELCLCNEWIHCVERLRHKRLDRNQPFHFIISASGDIFENRGWNNQTNTFDADIQSRSIIIGFLGNFSSNRPTLSSLMAFKGLLVHGLRNLLIGSNYTLLTENDVDNSKLDYKHLYNIIRTQAHFNKSVKADCKQVSNLCCILNGAICLVAMVIMLAFSTMLFNIVHINGCYQIRKLSINCRLYKLEVHCFTSESTIRLQYSEYIINNNECINVENTLFFWMNEQLNVRSCPNCHLQFRETIRAFSTKKMSINLNILAKLNIGCDKVTVSVLSRADTIHCKTIIVILHLQRDNFIDNFQNIVARLLTGHCVCSKYRIHLLDTQTKNSRFKKLLC